MPEGAKIIGTACNLHGIIDDKKLLIWVRNFIWHKFIISHVKFKFAMAMFGTRFLNTISKKKPRIVSVINYLIIYLSPIILIHNQMVYSSN